MKMAKRVSSAVLVLCLFFASIIPAYAVEGEKIQSEQIIEDEDEMDLSLSTPSDAVDDSYLDDSYLDDSEIIASFSDATELEGFYYSECIDGVEIQIAAESGVLPEGTLVKIQKIEKKDGKPICDIVQEADSILGAEVTMAIAYDISFWNKGNEVQPKNGNVTVTIKCTDVVWNENQDVEVFHLDDENQVELIDAHWSEQETSFEVNHFSVYGIAITQMMSDDILGNPLWGGTSEGKWRGNYLYFGWEGLGSNSNKGDDFWPDLRKVLGDNALYRWNGVPYKESSMMSPIKWRILYNNGHSLLLLSEHMLDVHEYATITDITHTWESSEMRRWLNHEFINGHFTDLQQEDILESTVTDEVSEDSNLPQGNTTEDKLFLPSGKELTNEAYGFPGNGSNSASRSAVYNDDSLRGRNTASDYSYWLRSRGDLNYTLLRPVFVTDNGRCVYGANRYCTWYLGVRPMIRLELDSERFGLDEDDENLLEGIRFADETIEIARGSVRKLEVEAVGLTENLSDIQWISSCDSVAEVDYEGNVTAKTIGETYVFAIKDNLVAGCKIRVKETGDIVPQYTVTFKDDGRIVDIQSVEKGKAAIAPALQKEGYFLTWDRTFDYVTEDLTVNAVWVKNTETYKIFYVLNGGINNKWNPETYVVGGGAVLQMPSYNGHEFMGWYLTEDFQQGTRIQLIPPNQTGDITVYAKWKNTDMGSQNGNSSGGGQGGSGSSSSSSTKAKVNDLYFKSEVETGMILSVGEKLNLKQYLVVDATGDAEPSLSWISSDDGKVSVDSTGVIHCNADGFANITVRLSSDSGKSARMLIRSVAQRVNDPTDDAACELYYTKLPMGLPMPNCTTYAWGRSYEILGIMPEFSIRNANTWWDYNAGVYESGTEPRKFSVACHSNRNHVLFVEDIVSVESLHDDEKEYLQAKSKDDNGNDTRRIKFDNDGNVVVFSQSSYNGIGKGDEDNIAYWGVDKPNRGGGTNTNNFAYGFRDMPGSIIKGYIYLDLNPYKKGMTYSENITDKTAEIKTELKSARHKDGSIIYEGYYIGKKKAELVKGKENLIKNGESLGKYQFFKLDNLSPNTTYYYQFYLTGQNGIEYRGNICEFTTGSR